MTLETFRKKVLPRLTDFLDGAGDLLLLVVVFSIAWKFLWGFVGPGLGEHVGVRVLDYFMSWSFWPRMPPPVRFSLR